jgi:phage terminase small subunit
MSGRNQIPEQGAPAASHPRNGFLNARQQKFVLEYQVDQVATQAAIRSGYSASTAHVQGSRLLSNVKVREAIAKAQAEAAAKAEVTVERIVGELAKIGFSNMQDYMAATPDGDPYLDFSKLTRDQAAALAEVTVEDFVDGRGEEARAIRRVKFKLHDKRAALVDLGRQLGMFRDGNQAVGVGLHITLNLGDGAGEPKPAIELQQTPERD